MRAGLGAAAPTRFCSNVPIFPGLVFPRDEFQVVRAGRKHHAALIDQIAVVHLLEALLVEVHVDRIAQLRRRSGRTARRGTSAGEIEFGLACRSCFCAQSSALEESFAEMGT